MISGVSHNGYDVTYNDNCNESTLRSVLIPILKALNI